jgi:acyl-CoA thioester hydrolase
MPSSGFPRSRERTESPPPEPHLTSRLEIRVRFCETDLMGIVHHANYLAYFEAGRVDWLRKRGVSYEHWTREDVHLPVIETHLRYRKSAKFEDVLVIETTRLDMSRVTVRFGYRVLRGEELLCEGDTLLACVGQAMGARRIPGFVTEVMNAAEP